VKPLKSQMKPELHYYPVTLFKTAAEVLGGFQYAELHARAGENRAGRNRRNTLRTQTRRPLRRGTVHDPLLPARRQR